MKKNDFSYDLPESLIARHPADRREGSKLLVHYRTQALTKHLRFSDLPNFLQAGDLLIRNNTSVIPARLFASRVSGAKLQLLLTFSHGGDEWTALSTKGGRLKEGEVLNAGELGPAIEMLRSQGEGRWRIRLLGGLAGEDALKRHGYAPLPPYIGRKENEAREFRHEDIDRYQTVYAKIPGAVAAPTAGLHFTPEVFQELQTKGVEIQDLTLHVGEGTFKPLTEENALEHKMHSEHYEVSEATASAIRLARRDGRRIVAVGTTSARTLETLALRFGNNPEDICACAGETDIFIHPPYEFKLVDALITNFHLPESTLLMLVSAMMGREKTLALYKEAVEKQYRFFSYGDCMLIL